MKYGSLPHSISRSLPAGEVEPSHAPDGLTENDVDALAAELGVDLEPPADDQFVAPVIPLHVDRPAVPRGDEAA